MIAHIRLPKTRLLAACLLFLSFFFIHQSCTKINTDAVLSAGALTDAEITQKFFAVPANAPHAVKRAAEEMKRRNSVSEYIVKFAKENGYPVWDKALISFNGSTTASFTGASSNIAGDEDTTVVLPLVPEGLQKVTGFVTANENDSIRLDLYRGGDYSKYSFEDRPGTEVNADKAVLQIMALNKLVFGYTSFEVSDNRLFSNESQYNPSVRPRRVTMKDTVLAQNLIAHCQSYEITIYLEVWYSDGSHIEIAMAHFTVWVGNCGSETGSSGGGGTGGSGFPIGGGISPNPGGSSPGTGGGGSGTPSNYPCPSTMDRNIPAMPCDGVPPPPVDPTPPPESPCEEGQSLLNTQGVIGKYDVLKSYIPGNREMAYSFNRNGGSVLSTGLLYQHRVDIKLVENCINYTHIHNAGSTYYMFSWTDMDEMRKNFANHLMAEKATVTLIARDSTPYIMTIQDPTTFANAIGNFIDSFPTDKAREDRYSEYTPDSEIPSVKIFGFLQYMKAIGAPVSLLRVDGCCDLMEIKLNAAGTALIETPCNPS